MLLGILSDSHDNAPSLAGAVALLQQRGAEFFIHCGDVCSPSMLDHLAGLPSAFVWGNCDADRLGLQRYGQSLNVQCYGRVGELTLAEKRIAFTHGDDALLRDRLLADQQHDYVLQGHTHIQRDIYVGKTRHINPGALQRAAVKSVALLDLTKNILEFLTIEVRR